MRKTPDRTLKPVIRQLPPPPPRWDERMWPVCASIIFFGLLLSAIVVFVHYRTNVAGGTALWRPLLWGALILALTMGAAGYLWNRSPRRSRPVLLLSSVLSLIINTTLLCLLALTWVFVPVQSHEPTLARDDLRKPVTIPEYLLPRITSVEQIRDFERPLETETPQAVGSNTARQNQPIDLQRRSADAATAVAETSARVPRSDTPSPPHRGPEPSLLRRQLAQHPGTSALSTVPSDFPSEANAARQNQDLRASNTDLTKNEVNTRLARATVSEETAMDRDHLPMAQTARREDTIAEVAQSEAVASLPRRQDRARALPRSSRPRPVEAVASRQTDDESIDPRATEVNRPRTMAQLDRRQPQVDFTQPNATPTSSSPRREVPREPAEHLAQTPRLERSQTARMPTTAPLTALANDTATPQQPMDARVTPTTTAVTQQVAQSTELQRATIVDQQDETSPTPQTPRLERRTNATQSPSIVSGDDIQLPTRTRRLAQTPASPRTVSAPAVAAANRDTDNPAAEPSRTAVTRAKSGVAGIGRSENLDQNSPAAAGLASLASASATRNAATQSLPDALAMTPSLPSRKSHSRGDRQAPSASVRAESFDAAMTYGALEPTPLDASAGAAVVRAAANAITDLATANRGTTEVDFGPTQIVNADSTGRAAGGGQPDLNTDTQSRLLSRTRTGGTRQPSLMTTRVANVPAAPAGGNNAVPSAPEAHPDAAAIVRTEAGGAAALSRGPSTAGDKGDPAFSSFADVAATPQLSRAAATESIVAAASAGGGLDSRRLRTGAGPPAISIVAHLPSLSGSEQSSGELDAEPIEATGSDVGRTAAGIEQATVSNNVGSRQENVAAVIGEALRNSRAGIAAASRSPSEARGPLADASETALPRHSPRPGLATARVNVSTEQAIAGAPTTSTIDPTATRLDGGASTGTLVRHEEGAVSMDRASIDGPAGLAMAPAAQAGLPTPKAQSASVHLDFQEARFIRSKLGGSAPTSTAVVSSTRAFQRRERRDPTVSQGPNGQPPPKTEEAIELGLIFITRHQRPDGRWSLSFDRDEPEYANEQNSLHSDTAATGLALLAYLGAGYHHKDDKYRQQVQAGLEHLITYQKKDGDLYIADDPVSAQNVALYSHGIACLALTEAYGMTQDSALRGPAQRALNYVLKTQHPRLGGWRYTPGVETDTSVSGWMIMALKSGELAGLDVDRSAYARITKWLDRAQPSADEPHLYRYNPDAPDNVRQGHGLKVTPSMTAVGLLTRMYTGWRRDHVAMQLGGEYLLQSPPLLGTKEEPLRDTYYWYYATQVLFHLGGDTWEAWNSQLHPLLIDSQIQTGKLAGSWNPRGPIPDRWAGFAGRLYVTTMNLLSLEVYYRHLPIYEDTAK